MIFKYSRSRVELSCINSMLFRRLCEQVIDTPRPVRLAVIRTIGRLSTSLDFSFYTSRIVHPLGTSTPFLSRQCFWNDRKVVAMYFGSRFPLIRRAFAHRHSLDRFLIHYHEFVNLQDFVKHTSYRASRIAIISILQFAIISTRVTASTLIYTWNRSCDEFKKHTNCKVR